MTMSCVTPWRSSTGLGRGDDCEAVVAEGEMRGALCPHPNPNPLPKGARGPIERGGDMVQVFPLFQKWRGE